MKCNGKCGILTMFCLLILVGCTALSVTHAWAYPVEVKDAVGNSLVIEKRPLRIVSLVPSATEIIIALDGQDFLQAVTHHSTNLRQVREKPIIGGFFAPSLSEIEKARPDMIILAPLHTDIAERFAHRNIPLVIVETRKLVDAWRNIRLLGRILQRQPAAEELIAENQKELAKIREKVAGIPRAERKRVVRLMGRDAVMAPGDDSFQNELIAAAGGIPPHWGRTGSVVAVDKDDWQRFNPQLIYGCGGDRQAANTLFSRAGWKDVDAVKNSNMRYFPCDLTCQASVHTGYFVSWLASVLYAEEFSLDRHRLKPDQVVASRDLDIDLAYIKRVRIANSSIYDFINKTLIVDFTGPQTVVSTLEGQRSGILTVGNHYSPPQCWGIGHRQGLQGIRERVYRTIDVSGDTSMFLFTGADMDHLAVKEARFREMAVHALVTAGVRSNAVRMSRDTGNYYEPGTINILLMTNMQLSPRAMTRAIISATEAKTAALMDMDVRSSYLPLRHRATGTGTDNIIVVQGAGTAVDHSGGHTKMGELIASAVHTGVREAILRQNGLAAPRNIFQRLAERRIRVRQLVSGAQCHCEDKKSTFAAAVEEALLDADIAAFIESALAISDAHEKGLVSDLSAFSAWCRTMAGEIAGSDVGQPESLLPEDGTPIVLRSALNAVLHGVRNRMQDHNK